jgi:3-dehydroquinate dehydratase-2
MASILVLNGPNLNLLGDREPGYYGSTSLDEIIRHLTDIAKKSNHTLTHYQSNAEHALVERIQTARRDHDDFIIINPAAFTHTSVALRDALCAAGISFIEVHLSNIYAREDFRRKSYFSDIAVGVISGLGAISYELALLAAIQLLEKKVNNIKN